MYMRSSAVLTLHQGKERTADKGAHTGKKNVRRAYFNIIDQEFVILINLLPPATI